MLRLTAGAGGEVNAGLLLDFGMDINGQDSMGNTALHVAMGRGSRSTLDWLVDHGIDESITNHAGQTGRDVAGLQPMRAFIPEHQPDPISPSQVCGWLDEALDRRLDETLPKTPKTSAPPRL